MGEDLQRRDRSGSAGAADEAVERSPTAPMANAGRPSASAPSAWDLDRDVLAQIARDAGAGAASRAMSLGLPVAVLRDGAAVELSDLSISEIRQAASTTEA